jgi:WD40 repeat protein
MIEDPQHTHYRVITPATVHRLQHLGQLGHHDGFSYPKHIQWHPTAPLLALSYPINEPAGTARLALWTPWGTCRSTITETNEHLREIPFYSVGWSADGQVMAHGFKAIQVAPADTRTRQILPGTQLLWSPTGHVLATTDTTRVILWDLDRGRTTVLPESAGIQLGWNAAFCWVDATTVRGATQTHISTWDHAGNQTTRTAFAARFSPSSMSESIPTWSPGGHALALWTDTTVAIMHADGSVQAVVPSGTTACFRIPVAWHPTGTSLATIDDWHVQLWDVTGTQIQTFVGTHYGVACLAWSPDGQLLATGSWDSTICLWSREGMLLHTLFTAHIRHSMAAVFILSWSPDSRYLVASLRDCSIQVYAIPVDGSDGARGE